MRPVSEGSEPSDVIGMEMGVHSLDELQVQLAQKLEVAIHLLQHGIDDQGFAATSTGQKVTVGAGRAVEHLTEDHGSPPITPSPHLRGSSGGARSGCRVSGLSSHLDRSSSLPHPTPILR